MIFSSNPPATLSQPWPWPLAPLWILVLLAVSAIVLGQLHRHVIAAERATQEPGISILAGFRTEILPVLVALWAAIIVLFLLTGSAYWWAILPWATVTLLMLWPVGARFERAYFSYRRPLFVLGVASMAYLILAGFALQSTLPFLAKSLLFWGLLVDLTLFGLLPGLRVGISRPIAMFFRPDLIFGDGRVLCCGTIALVVAVRYMLGAPAMGGAPWPVPVWNWYAIFLAMVFGFIPLIAVRGLLKLLLRLRRMRDGVWDGWGATILREGLLVFGLAVLGYAFHNNFMGQSLFTWVFLTDRPAFWEALGIILLGALFLIFVRGAYKMSIGDPFLRETPGQTLGKQLLYVVGAIIFYYGLMSLMHMTPSFARVGQAHLRTLNLGLPAQFWIGFAIFVWGILLLIPGRVLVQVYQRQAMVSQMAAVIVPTFRPAQQRRMLEGMIRALMQQTPRARVAYLQAINEGLAGASAHSRATMTRTMVELLGDMPLPERDRIMEGIVAALARLPEAARATRMTDMLGAVSELPQEKRRALIEKMATLLA